MTDDRYTRTTFRGVTVDRYTEYNLRLAEKKLGYTLTLYQGSYHKGVGASAGTHDGGGAVDLAPYDWRRKVRVLRDLGFAAWHRPAIRGVWSEHIHAILIGNTKASASAKAQVASYKNGRNGLANNAKDSDTYRPSPVKDAAYPGAAPEPFSSSIYQQNAASRHPNWTKRAALQAKAILAADASFVTFEELYVERRPLMTTLLRPKYTLGVSVKGKAIYYRTGRWRLVKDSARKYDLGNGKNGAALKAQHIATGKFLNVAVAHTSWQHAYASQRFAEVTRLINLVKADFPHNRTVYAGDWNDSLKPIASRPVDSTGKAMKARGYRDLFGDVPKPVNAELNSAGTDSGTHADDGIHLDRVFGGNVRATKWVLDAKTPPGSDHYGLFVQFDLI